jgi:hypothetical protein
VVGRQSGAFRRRSFDIRRKKTFLFLFFARNGKRTSRDALLFITPRTVAFRSRREESPPRIAPNRESRFFAETVRGREARGAGSARDRASRDVGGCRRDERVVSSRCASRARSRREPGGRWMRGRARGPSRVLGWSISITGTDARRADAKGGTRRACGIPSGRRVAEHTHRARHVPPGRGREAET